MKKIISIILYTVSILSVALLSFILIANNVLPFKYRASAIGIMALIEIFLLFLLLKKHGKKKKDRIHGFNQSGPVLHALSGRFLF